MKTTPKNPQTPSSGSSVQRLVSRLFTVFFTFGETDGCCGYVTLRAKNKTDAKAQWLAENPDDRITKVINGRIRFKFVYSANH
jgi:hypothetical protein